jgi:hypothetical protein
MNSETASGAAAASAHRPVQRRMLGGLLVRREAWRLSGRGFLVLCVTVLAVLAAILWSVYPFLAVTRRVPSETLVVEGWGPPSTMIQAAEEFHAGGYKRLMLIRPILDKADKYESGRYSGDYMANLLLQYGVPRDQEFTLFPVVARKDRTYHSALVVKQWLEDHGLADKSLDLATLGAHARRSRLMYEKAFGANAQIGIIAIPSREFDPAHWGRTSEGVREVIGESIAYLYARLLFRPPAS